MKKILLSLLCIPMILTGCDQGPKKGADGYQFTTPQYEETRPDIRIVLHDSVEDLRKELGRIQRENKNLSKNDPIPNNDNIMAFSLITDDHKICVINMVHPSKEYYPEYIGHELTHCVFGQWHESNKVNNPY